VVIIIISCSTEASLGGKKKRPHLKVKRTPWKEWPFFVSGEVYDMVSITELPAFSHVLITH
jgi:hypothetical protein